MTPPAQPLPPHSRLVHTQAVSLLIAAGAKTSRFFPALGATPSDYVMPGPGEEPPGGPAAVLYTLLGVHRLTGCNYARTSAPT